MNAPDRPSRDAASRHATLLLLVVMVVAASPGVFKVGMLGPGRAGQDRIAQTSREGEVRIVRAEPRDETRPAPADVRRNQLVRARNLDRAGLPFRAARERLIDDRRPDSGGAVVLSNVALPPPLA